MTHDRELAPGWRHIVAVKARGLLKLFIDGQCMAQSSRFDPEEYGLSTPLPLRIGFGQHDHFNGRMMDLCLVVPEGQDPSVNDWDASTSLKVKGPDYVKGSTDCNELWMDRVILERPSKDEKADAGGVGQTQPEEVNRAVPP